MHVYIYTYIYVYIMYLQAQVPPYYCYTYTQLYMHAFSVPAGSRTIKVLLKFTCVHYSYITHVLLIFICIY